MKMQLFNNNIEVTLMEGVYQTYPDNYSEYLCVGKCGSNRILFQYIDRTKDIVDYVQTIADNIPQFALDYLIQLLNTQSNLLVRLVFEPDTMTGFEIYYDCDCENDDLTNLIYWMYRNNDFAASEYRYTEIKNGHQQCVGE